MSDEIGKLADELHEISGAIGAVNTAGVTGRFGGTLDDQKIGFQKWLEEFNSTLDELQGTADAHRLSESTFVSTAPTLADVEEAGQKLVSLQQSGPASTLFPLGAGVIDVLLVQAIQKAEARYNQLSQERRNAVRVFLADQTTLADQITSTLVPKGDAVLMPDRRDGELPPLAAPDTGSNGAPEGTPLSGVLPPRATVDASGSSSRTPDVSPPTAASVDDVLSSGAPVPAGGGTQMMPFGAIMQPAGMGHAAANRVGPQVMPGYTIPGTSISAGQATPMSTSDFNSLLDRLRSDRMNGGPSLPTSPSVSGGGGGGGGGGGPAAPANKPAAARLMQPTSWSNATASTGVSEASSRSATTAPTSSNSATPARSSAMPMAPMAPMAPNNAGASKSSTEQPQIKNADPDVYGDDVQTTDPIIDNKGGRFT